MRKAAWLSGLALGSSLHFVKTGENWKVVFLWVVALAFLEIAIRIGVTRENQIIREIEEARRANVKKGTA